MYWLASHGQPIPAAARRAILFVRWHMGEPYSLGHALRALAKTLEDSDGEG